ncbi:hypothetical protein ACFXKF_37775 [Streptomyces scopuliridis]|uniref:hypothetical protein n=1 Tax=Streptomyces scopuliridis TaxID=452529 RepID=UPI0036CE8B15
MRADPAAFGLYDATYAAGERLADVMATLAGTGLDGTDFPARFTVLIGGEGGTVTDAAIRRAAAEAAQRLMRHPEAAAGGALSGGLLCLLYEWFFAGVVAEFLKAVVAEKVKLVVPVLPVLDPEDHIADWVADHVLKLLPSPCDEAARLVEKAETALSVVEDPAVTLPEVARALVPRTAGRALGLITEQDAGEEAA